MREIKFRGKDMAMELGYMAPYIREQTKPSEFRPKIVDCYKCNDCGRQLMFSKGKAHIVCPACGSESLERTTMGEMLNKTITVTLTNEDN